MKYRVDELHNLYKIACQLEYKKEQCKAHNYIQLAQAYDKILITLNALTTRKQYPSNNFNTALAFSKNLFIILTPFK